VSGAGCACEQAARAEAVRMAKAAAGKLVRMGWMTS
jgi:hypothetical protein